MINRQHYCINSHYQFHIWQNLRQPHKLCVFALFYGQKKYRRTVLCMYLSHWVVFCGSPGLTAHVLMLCFACHPGSAGQPRHSECRRLQS